jgi:hypothetical protein
MKIKNKKKSTRGSSEKKNGCCTQMDNNGITNE